MQNPKTLTRLTCCSFAVSITPFLNSSNPCLAPLENNFYISCPFANTPCNIDSTPACLVYIFDQQAHNSKIDFPISKITNHCLITCARVYNYIYNPNIRKVYLVNGTKTTLFSNENHFVAFSISL